MRIFYLFPFLLVSLAQAQAVFTGVNYHAGYFPDKLLPGLATDYTADRSWLTKPMEAKSFFTGYSLQMGFKVPLGFWLGGNFSWNRTNYKAKGIQPTDNQDITHTLRIRYNTAGLVLSHALVGSNNSQVSLHAEATLDYGHFMTKTRIRPDGDGWQKYDRDANGVWSTRLSPVIRIKSKETDGSYIDIKPFYVYAFRDNLSFSETGNALVQPQTQTHAPYLQGLSHFGISIAFIGISGGEHKTEDQPTEETRKEKG